MGRLTTHVLDTAHGKPAHGMRVVLRALDRDGAVVVEAITNSDGRIDGPLLDEQSFTAGRYELSFDVAPYFRAQGVELPDPPFLDTVTLQFGLAADEHYHVPLLVSPWSYSTYRGS